MQRILAIFRKDARHLRLQIGGFWALLLLAALTDPTITGQQSGIFDFVPTSVLPAACWLLIISAIHEDKLIGDRQYWLTRPYSWRELLAAKVLFVLAVINLPLLIYHAGVYLTVGVPIGDHLATLLWKQVFFIAFYILPPAALAAVTRSLGRILLTALAGFLFIWVVSVSLILMVRRPLLMWRGLNEAGMVTLAAVLVAGGAAILVLQYSRRGAREARALAGVVFLAAFGLTAFGGALAPQHSRAASNAQITLDPDPSRHSSLTPGSRRDLATLDLPIRLSSIPSDAILEQTQAEVRIETAGRLATSPKRGALHDFHGDRAWLSIFTDRSVVEAAESKPVIVSGTVIFQRFAHPKVLPLPKGQAVAVPGVGVCRDSLEGEGWISFSCYSPSPRAALMIGNAANRVNWIVPQGSVETSVPASTGFEPLEQFVSQVSYRSWAQVGDAHLLVAEPLPPVRIDFRLSGIRLADYAVGQ